jgi:hypothetical protein
MEVQRSGGFCIDTHVRCCHIIFGPNWGKFSKMIIHAVRTYLINHIYCVKNSYFLRNLIEQFLKVGKNISKVCKNSWAVNCKNFEFHDL